MGSSNSRMGLDPSRPPASHRIKFSLTSLLCGTSFSDDDLLLEDQATDASVSPSRLHDSMVDDNFQRSVKELLPIICSESDSSSSTVENANSCQTSNGTIEDMPIYSGSRNAETSNSSKILSESKELVPCQDNGGCRLNEVHSGRNTDQGITCTKPLSFESSSADMDTTLAPSTGIDSFVNQMHPNRMPSGQQEPGDSSTTGISFLVNRSDEVSGSHSADSNSPSASSDSSVPRQTLVDEPVREAEPLGSRFITPISRREWRNGNVLHVDMVSISSNILSSRTGDISNREARRNSRRLFWDAFSRRSSRRNDDSPSIFFSTESTDDLGSYDRWLLDFSSDIFDNGVGDDSVNRNSRSQGANERRRHSRSEVWERLRGDLGENSGRTTFCASGLHPEGTCSCETFMLAEETGTRASISRIVMLAEALFEVLDEIHRQPVSLSLSMMSRPAPESIVNSFPLKSYTKTNKGQSGEDVEQCYICLAEYEEGDKVRTLPCRHEYHMSCVDKWLKEIHGVCPLCRGDVCEGTTNCPTSIS